jgi:hypothetical protein
MFNHTLNEMKLLLFALELALEKTTELKDPDLDKEIADMERMIDALAEHHKLRKRILEAPI